jgi:hypothetical protein
MRKEVGIFSYSKALSAEFFYVENVEPLCFFNGARRRMPFLITALDELTSGPGTHWRGGWLGWVKETHGTI